MIPTNSAGIENSRCPFRRQSDRRDGVLGSGRRETRPDRHDLERELEELLANLLEWAGLDVTGGEQYQEDAYFDSDERDRRSLKLVDYPLPEIESEYAAQAMLKRVDAAREQFEREIEAV